MKNNVSGKKVNIGILGPSEIAMRRFLPAIASNERFSFIGVAIADSEEWAFAADETVSEREKAKAENIKKVMAAKFLTATKTDRIDEINAVYIPLPPSLHYMGKSRQ